MHFCQHTSRLPTHGIVQTTTHLPETTLPNALAAGLHTQQLQQGAFSHQQAKEAHCTSAAALLQHQQDTSGQQTSTEDCKTRKVCCACWVHHSVLLQLKVHSWQAKCSE